MIFFDLFSLDFDLDALDALAGGIDPNLDGLDEFGVPSGSDPFAGLDDLDQPKATQKTELPSYDSNESEYQGSYENENYEG